MIRKDQGEVAVLLSVKQDGEVEIDSYCLPLRKKNFTRDNLRNAYLAASIDVTLHDKEAHYGLSSYLSSIYSMDEKSQLSNLNYGDISEVVHAQTLRYGKLFDIRRKQKRVSVETPKTFENDKIAKIRHGFLLYKPYSFIFILS